MRSWRHAVNIAVVGVSVLLCGAPASAEWFGDLFLGGAFTENGEPTAQVLVGGVPSTLRTQDARHDDAIVFGGRVGYWIDRLPYVGAGLDVSHFDPDVPAQTRPIVATPDPFGLSGPVSANRIDLDVTVISFDLMLRWPLLTSPAFPKGQLQPYVGVGPAVFITKATDHGNLGPTTQSDTDATIGVKVAGGLTWMFTPMIGVFTEYRFLHWRPENTFDQSADLITRAPFTATGSEHISTHQVVAGVTFRF